MIANKIEVEPVFSGMLLSFFSFDFLDSTKEETRKALSPLISSGAYSLTEDLPYNTRSFLAVNHIDTGEEIFDAEFKAGVCIAIALTIHTDDLGRCARRLRETGWSYKSGVKRWTKRGLPYAWRAQQSEKDRHLLTCRRLLPAKVTKSV